jgi:5-methylcytosine-specific restriction endonuclease McrA
MQILGLDIAGHPRAWLSLNDAITAHAKGQVVWSLGDIVFRARGGYQNSGEQSIIETAGIISIRSDKFNMSDRNVPLSNKTLFGRDRHTCAYCGLTFRDNQLSRDHVIPKSRGGLDTWLNVVCACKWCNNKKDDRIPEEAEMPLLFLPYSPSFNEKLLLENRNIMGDQMDFLRQTLPKNSRCH